MRGKGGKGEQLAQFGWLVSVGAGGGDGGEVPPCSCSLIRSLRISWLIHSCVIPHPPR